MLSILLVVLTFASSMAQSSAQYIDQHKDLAQKLMNEHGVPASVILAVAMHESANGGSKIAKHLHNHFGIKGKNNSRKIRSAYKGYGSVRESYNDFVAFLKKRSRTKPLFESNRGSNSRLWVRNMAKSGYSETGSWSKQILATIKRHNLTAFDQQGNTFETQEEATPRVAKKAQKGSSTANYRVKSGDNLWTIARKNNISVNQLKSLNNLSSSKLSIGQKLKI